MIEQGKFICSHRIQNPHSNSRVLIASLFLAHKNTHLLTQIQKRERQLYSPKNFPVDYFLLCQTDQTTLESQQNTTVYPTTSLSIPSLIIPVPHKTSIPKFNKNQFHLDSNPSSPKPNFINIHVPINYPPKQIHANIYKVVILEFVFDKEYQLLPKQILLM